MTTEIATRAPLSSLAIQPEQTQFTPAQVAALKQLGIDDAPEGDLAVFFHQAKRSGLDPFAKQIYMIGRRTKVGGYGNGPERWETKYTIQTGIDGYRLNGRRAAEKAGEKIRTDGPYWHGTEGGWTDVWIDRKPPAAAKFTIFRDGEAFTGTAMYTEFVQTSGTGENQRPTGMWQKMPANQLAKCAEAQAWRKAYPEDFSGIQLEDSTQTIEFDGNPTAPVHARTERMSAADILDEDGPCADAPAGGAGGAPGKPDTTQVIITTPAPAAPQQQAAEQNPAAPGAEPAREPAPTDQQLKDLKAALVAEGLKTARQQVEYLRKQFGRPVGALFDLTGREASELTHFLMTAPKDAATDTGEQLAVDGNGGE